MRISKTYGEEMRQLVSLCGKKVADQRATVALHFAALQYDSPSSHLIGQIAL